MRILLFILIIISLFSCSKKESISSESEIIPQQWEKFIGNYNVYDTLGNYLYNMDIKHDSVAHYSNGNRNDWLKLINFVDTFDLRFVHSPSTFENDIDFGFHDSIVDYNNKSWNISALSDDLSTPIRENNLINDTIVLYFRQTNIKYYIPEAQPYYSCYCKHVAVKQ